MDVEDLQMVLLLIAFLVEYVEDLQTVLLLIAFLVESVTSLQQCFRISLGWHLHFTLREETIQH
jgi:hypothetical protein